MDAANRTSHLKKIENAFVKSREYGDDKVQLAMQTYEMVSKYTCFSLRDHDCTTSSFSLLNSECGGIPSLENCGTGITVKACCVHLSKRMKI